MEGYFATSHVKKGEGAYFKYDHHEFTGRINYDDRRKNKKFQGKEADINFGSQDIMKRDEFTNHFRAQQWKQTLATETRFNAKFSKENAARIAARGGDSLDSLVAQPTRKQKVKKENEWRKSRGLPACFQTQVPDQLYDIGKETEGGATPICNKCSRETFYCKHRVGTGVATARRLGGTEYQTSGREIGARSWGVSSKPAYGRTNTTKQFFDISHIN